MIHEKVSVSMKVEVTDVHTMALSYMAEMVHCNRASIQRWVGLGKKCLHTKHLLVHNLAGNLSAVVVHNLVTESKRTILVACMEMVECMNFLLVHSFSVARNWSTKWMVLGNLAGNLMVGDSLAPIS